MGTDGRGQVPAHLGVVHRDGAQGHRPVALHGGRRHEGCPESRAHEPEHQRIIDNLKCRLRGAERIVDDGPDAPARRKPQDHLFAKIGGCDLVSPGERMLRTAYEDHRLAPQSVQDDSTGEFSCEAVTGTRTQRDVHRAVADRLQVPHGARRILAELDDDAGVAVPDTGEDLGEVKRPGVEGAGQRDRAAHLPGDGGDVVLGGLHGFQDPLSPRPQRCPVLGQGDRCDVPVE